MTGLTYRGKPARVDPHLPPVGFRWRRGVELVPRIAWRDEEAYYFVVSPVTAALRLEARFRRLFDFFPGDRA